jgi:hypothetical protein
MSDALSADTLGALFRDFAGASKVWAPSDYREGQKLAKALGDFLHNRLSRVMAAAPELPMLLSYQSDATSFLTRSRWRKQLPGRAADVRREGNELTELLLERLHVVVKGHSGSDDLSAIMIAPPRHLLSGKQNANLFSAGCDFIPSARPVRKGIVLHHVSFDRAVFDGLANLFEGRLACMGSEEYAAECTGGDEHPWGGQFRLVLLYRMSLPRYHRRRALGFS